MATATAKQPTNSSISPMKTQSSSMLNRNNLMTPGGKGGDGRRGDGFEEAITEEDKILNVYAMQFGREFVDQVRESVSFKAEETGLECPELESNPIFKLLRNRVRLFFFQQEDYRRNGPSR